VGLAGRALDALVRPLLTEPVDVATECPPEEVVRRLEGWTTAGWFLFGWGFAVRHRGDGHRLAERHGRPYYGRPRAFVRVATDGAGARVTGVLRATRLGWLTQVAALLVATGSVFTEADPARRWVSLALVPLLAVLQAVIHADERKTLLAFIEELVA
jgi:hypothetical protein